MMDTIIDIISQKDYYLLRYMTKNKFNIGDKVRFTRDSEYDAGFVLGMSFNDNEWSYKISSKEVDHEKKEVIEGVKSCKESELVEVK